MAAPTSLSGLSLRDMEYAVAVGQERHFGRAAERCHVSQAALSEQVRKLESVLGVALFERTKRRVEPTARGVEILRAAESLLAEARHLLESARRSAEPLTGTLRLGAIATLGPYYLPSVLRESRTLFPRLDLHLSEGRTLQLLDELRRGELDAALVALPVDGDGFTVEPLFFEPFRLACTPYDALATRADITIRDLRSGNLLLMEEGHCMRDQAIALCDLRGRDRAARFASSLEMLRHMIAAGEGYSVLPAMAARGEHDIGGMVVYRDIADSGAGRTIGLMWRATETRAADLHAIAEFLRQALPDGTQALVQPIVRERKRSTELP